MGANRLTILSTNPTAIFQAPQNDDYFINNTGTVTVYLSDERNVTADQGAPLPVGATKIWEAGLPLYAIAASGSGTINMSRNSGDLTNPAAIASSLLTSGLATAIADAIYITGAPPVDKFTTLVDTDALSFPGYDSGLIDVSSYASVNLTIINGGTILSIPAEFFVSWWADAGGLNLIATDSFCMCNGNNTYVALPVRGRYMQIQATVDAGSGTADISAFGSLKLRDRVSFSGEAGTTSGGATALRGANGMQVWNGTIPISTTWTWQPDIVSVNAQLIIRFGPANTLGGVILFTVWEPTVTFVNDALVSETVAPVTSGQVKSYDLLLPPRPARLSMQNLSGTQTLAFRAILLSQQPYV